MVVISASTVVLLALPCFMLISSPLAYLQIMALTMLAIMGGLIAGCAYLFIISLFSPQQRFSGVAFSYNLGIALCGGTSAAISRWLVEATNLHYAPAFYIILTSSLFLSVTYIFKREIRQLLNQNLKK